VLGGPILRGGAAAGGAATVADGATPDQADAAGAAATVG
jgi:hypothetical protein